MPDKMWKNYLLIKWLINKRVFHVIRKHSSEILWFRSMAIIGPRISTVDSRSVEARVGDAAEDSRFQSVINIQQLLRSRTVRSNSLTLRPIPQTFRYPKRRKKFISRILHRSSLHRRRFWRQYLRNAHALSAFATFAPKFGFLHLQYFLHVGLYASAPLWPIIGPIW